jgi:NADH-quinone oxidoreductase subunit J
MMLDINIAPLREGFARYFPVAVIVAVVMFLEMLALMGVNKGRIGPALSATDPATAAGLSNIEWLARALFTDFMLPFEVAAVILTVAIVIAVMLTLRRRPNTKHQDPARQVQVRREDRIRLVKVKADARREEGQP